MKLSVSVPDELWNAATVAFTAEEPVGPPRGASELVQWALRTALGDSWAICQYCRHPIELVYNGDGSYWVHVGSGLIKCPETVATPSVITEEVSSCLPS